MYQSLILWVTVVADAVAVVDREALAGLVAVDRGGQNLSLTSTGRPAGDRLAGGLHHVAGARRAEHEAEPLRWCWCPGWLAESALPTPSSPPLNVLPLAVMPCRL